MSLASRHAVPTLLRDEGPAQPLQRVMLGKDVESGDRREAFIQDLIHRHPEVIPITEIEPAFSPLISICRELPTSAGFLDNLWLTPSGGIVLGEAKLFRNPEARREVIAQALDYARAIGSWHYDDLEQAARKAARRPDLCLWDMVRDSSDLDEASFVDAVERRLRQSRFLVLIIGDGIQEGVEALTNHLQLHAGLHVGLALVDLSIWNIGEGLLVVPRIPLRTLLVERGIVLFAPDAGVQIQAPTRMGTAEKGTSPKPYTASEPEFYEQLDQRRPGLSAKLRPFLDGLVELGVTPEFRRSVVLRWQAGPDITGSLGYVDIDGRGWFGDAWNTAVRLGQREAGDHYLQTLAGLIGGSVRRYDKSAPRVLGPDGKVVDVDPLLDRAPAWQKAMTQLVTTLTEVS
ncbi:MAG: hypothetical protein COT28_21740 [Methylobacterium sp. CG08_land_8_20_14_0_20_71_15]|uniref:DUF4268 domain-containing protein n=2 Tax=Methylobacterium TaxID=407 RepID=A0ABQ4SUF5_9HYPH|nr:hypothetical protein [Methylobacterium jeotgali]PIU06539.1 MAG: hypothetical protein COT56_09530 [Methylobacterium sp. CG09_land_8_20_14_0_10_71_15]PIU11107.1 MAG: hypothetical protein COT28_21740 [Methylobacterium sp. CG08_land_8_20_14_0_20_71_15]GBU16502.1 hypothetical protein AwMethylo_07170 [Methylobacterium sp.]GJE06109.1 hypothetical protein AOPFMNJM_1415 [Methylobacterium jeotgali]